MPLSVHITELSHEQFGEAESSLAKIYESSFPPYEREAFTTTFDGAGTHTVLGAYAGGEFAGFADVFRIGGREAILRYLAVDAQYRSQGIGRALLSDITQRWESQLDRIIFEVESPPHAPDPAYAARRIRFYERWGAHQVRCVDGYFFPCTLDISQAVPVLLFEWHRTGGCLRADRLRDTLNRLYEHCYGADAARYHLETLLNRVIC